MGANVDASAIAGRMPEFVRQIQRERMGRNVNAPPQNVAGVKEFETLLNQTPVNEQEQNAAPAPGALQKERGQERGRQRNVGQRETEGRIRQSPQVQRAKERQRPGKMR
jgi:hypothetical protein